MFDYNDSPYLLSLLRKRHTLMIITLDKGPCIRLHENGKFVEGNILKIKLVIEEKRSTDHIKMNPRIDTAIDI
jgi:hypothetical protein